MLVDAAAALSIRCNIGGRRRQKYRHIIVNWLFFGERLILSEEIYVKYN